MNYDDLLPEIYTTGYQDFRTIGAGSLNGTMGAQNSTFRTQVYLLDLYFNGGAYLVVSGSTKTDWSVDGSIVSSAANFASPAKTSQESNYFVHLTNGLGTIIVPLYQVLPANETLVITMMGRIGSVEAESVNVYYNWVLRYQLFKPEASI